MRTKITVLAQHINVIMLEKQDLLDLALWKMPYGKYAGRALIDLPEEYLLWFIKHGWPEGRLGYLLKICLEIKVDGSESIIKTLRKKITEDQSA